MSSSAAGVRVYPTASVRRSGGEGWVTLVLLSLGHCLVDLYSSALGIFQPGLVAKHHMSLTQAGILGGMLVFSGSVTQPLYGWLSDRFRTRLFVVLAPALAGTVISGLGLAPDYRWLLAMALLGGAGVAAFHPQASARVTEGVREHRGRWMAIFISSGSLGMAVGPTYFSALISRLGLSGAAVGAIPGVVVSALLGVCLRRTSEARERGKGFDWRPLQAVWKPLTVLYFLVFIRSIVQITFAQLLPLYLQRERGLTLGAASYALTIYLTFGALGGFTGGHLSDRWGGRTVILISMLGCVPFLLLFFFSHGPVSIAALAMSGLLLLFTTPVNVVMAQELAPSQAGTVSALMMGFSWGMAGIIFIPLTGWASDHFGMQAAMSSLALFPVLGFLLALRLPKRREG